ncbi:glutamate 5-kinase [Pontibacillus salicampi]|uniref:Glutamate 5-kinase n=1 Tax=Pontibacillus salicampi TaxID=1449801 RepID=A0ABV6LQA5_9BACI
MNDNNNKRIAIKIGSSSLTSAHGEISRRKLEKLVDEIVRLKDEGHEVLLVSSGAVAAGYRKLGCLKRPTALPEKQAAASIGQGLLIESYSELFAAHGYIASQILITRSDFSDENRYNNARNTINVLLDRGIIPIVNENDTITMDFLKFGDNDTLSAKVAGLVEADQLLILSDIDGLYNENPNENPNAALIEKVTEITPDIEAMAGGAGSSVGTGGMTSKIDAFKIAMASGITSFIGKATVENIVYDAVHHTAQGTYFVPNEEGENLDRKQQWIAFHSGPEGEIVVNASTVEAFVEKQQCLLPNGVSKVEGDFEKGAVVRILDEDGNHVGLGIVNYSSETFRQYNKVEKEVEGIEQVVMEREHFVGNQEFSFQTSV